MTESLCYKNTVWIINQYAGSKYHGMVFRSYYLSKELLTKGWNVKIISASYSHLFRKQPAVNSEFTDEVIDNINYCWVKTNAYKESNGVARVVSMFSFMLKLFKLPLNANMKPSVIIVSSPSPLSIVNGYFYAKKYNAKLIYEVRDLWPLTLIELANFSKFNPFIIFMQLLENFAYHVANHVVSVLPGTKEYMISHGMDADKFEYIPNGIDVEELSLLEAIDDDVSRQIPSFKFIVGHLGTLGMSHSLDCFIAAANLLKNNMNIHFVLVGDGPEKNRLKSLVSGDNVTFIDPISKSKVQTLLSFFDICYLGCPKEKIYKYGISANKVFDYMYSSKPILHSGAVGNDPVEEASCGITVAPEDPDALVAGIEHLLNIGSEQRAIMGQNGRKYVLENHTYKQLANKYIRLFEV